MVVSRHSDIMNTNTNRCGIAEDLNIVVLILVANLILLKSG